MKRLVLAALTAAISMGAVAPAMAWGYNHCVAATNLGASSGTAIKHCAPFLAANGEISFGSHKGETWSEAFPGTENLGSRVTYVDRHAKTLSNYATGRTMKDYTYTWKIDDGHDALKTKQIAGKDWAGYINKHDLTIPKLKDS